MTYDSWKLSNGYVANANEDLIAEGNDLIERWKDYLLNLDEDDQETMTLGFRLLLADTKELIADAEDIEDETVQDLIKEITDLMHEALG